MSLHRFLLRSVLVPLFGLLLPLVAQAQVPSTLSYQGRLTDADGTPLPDGAYNLTLRLYARATDGTALWTETQKTTVTDGIFNLTLGTETPLTKLPFDTAYWLGVAVAGVNNDDELSPRTPLTAAPYSHRARLLDDAALVAGDNITLERSEQALRISATAGTGLTLPVDETAEVSTAPAFSITNTGSQSASEFIVDNIDNFNSAILAWTNGTGATIFSRTFGLGRAGLFRVESFSNTSPALEVFTAGTGGTAFLANHDGASGDIAVFQSNDQTVARIDKNGVGFFNGGVQSSGADVAELFAVEGTVAAYEPGDVLVISTRADRHLAKSTESYSTLVAGVYATKPGVILTGRPVDADVSDLVHLGVVGVIPTKVTAENGPIRRGDLLVTASRPGHAMKGTDTDRLVGAVLGKALENLDRPGTGVIRVLVNAQ